MSEKCNIVPGSGNEIADTSRTADTCNKCGERTELVFVRIPAKPNADSEGNPNGIPG
jgi:hypothetical protein